MAGRTQTTGPKEGYTQAKRNETRADESLKLARSSTKAAWVSVGVAVGSLVVAIISL
jgi:hypothetical protein